MKFESLHSSLLWNITTQILCPTAFQFLLVSGPVLGILACIVVSLSP